MKKWLISDIEELGFELITNDKLWCHFRGHLFDVFINLDTNQVEGNIFNFRSYKNSFKGNFRAELTNTEDFKTLLKILQ